MSKKQPDIPLWELEGFEGISRIVAGRPLYHFSSVHSFHFGQREDELGDPWTDVELVLEELELPRARIGFRFHHVGQVSLSGFSQVTGLFPGDGLGG